MKKTAVFDIDGTIFRSSLLIETVEALLSARLFPESAREEFAGEFEKWLTRKGDYESYIGAVIEVFMKYIKGVAYAEFMDAVEKMMEQEKDKVYVYTRDLLKELKKKDYFLLAISQSPKSIVDKFCKNLGFDKAYGRIYELGPQNRFTGNVTDVHLIENKANIVRRAVEKEGLTLADSYGIGDTESDISFLELVEHPI